MNDEERLVDAFNDAVLAFQRGKIELMQATSLDIARELLDYEKMARRITS